MKSLGRGAEIRHFRGRRSVKHGIARLPQKTGQARDDIQRLFSMDYVSGSYGSLHGRAMMQKCASVPSSAMPREIQRERSPLATPRLVRMQVQQTL